jgi:hypothetical protein
MRMLAFLFVAAFSLFLGPSAARADHSTTEHGHTYAVPEKWGWDVCPKGSCPIGRFGCYCSPNLDFNAESPDCKFMAYGTVDVAGGSVSYPCIDACNEEAERLGKDLYACKIEKAKPLVAYRCYCKEGLACDKPQVEPSTYSWESRPEAETWCSQTCLKSIPNCNGTHILTKSTDPVPEEVRREEVEAGGTYRLRNPLKAANFTQLVGSIINTGLGLLGSLAFLMFVYGGFLWLTAGGAADRISKGKDVMKWAVIGLILVFGSYALVRFVLQAFTSL